MRVRKEIVKSYNNLLVKFTIDDVLPHEQTLIMDKIYDYLGNLVYDYDKGESLIVHIKVDGNGVENVVKRLDEIEDLFLKAMTDFEHDQENAFNILTLALGYLRISDYALETINTLAKLLSERLKQLGES